MFIRKNDRTHLFFYNCGSNSGASVLHKHIQAIPIDRDELPIQKLIDKHHIHDEQLVDFPFVHRICKLSSNDPQYIFSKFHSVLISAMNATKLDYSATISASKTLTDEPINFISYNVLFTTSWILVVPRSKEFSGVKNVNGVSVNSLGFAGMLLVKSNEQLQFVKEFGTMNILTEVAYSINLR